MKSKIDVFNLFLIFIFGSAILMYVHSIEKVFTEVSIKDSNGNSIQTIKSSAHIKAIQALWEEKVESDFGLLCKHKICYQISIRSFHYRTQRVSYYLYHPQSGTVTYKTDNVDLERQIYTIPQNEKLHEILFGKV